MTTVSANLLLLAVLTIAPTTLFAQPAPQDTAKAEAAKLEGDRLAKTADFAAAIASYDRAIRIDPKFAAAFKARGMAYRRSRQTERALQDYDEAIQLDPEDAELYFERGGAHLTLHQIDAAIQNYDTAIEKKPAYAQAYSARGGAKSQAGDTPGAQTDWDQAEALGFSIKRIRVGGGVEQAKLIRQTRPTYPPEARKAHIRGTVRLDVIIAKDGTIQDLKVVSGPPMLTPAAVEAVKQWVYQPTTFDGRPVEVVTQIDVNFTVNGK